MCGRCGCRAPSTPKLSFLELYYLINPSLPIWQVRLQGPFQAEAPRAGSAFGLGILAFDRYSNPLRAGGNTRLQLKQLTGPPPSSHPVPPPPMMCQVIVRSPPLYILYTQ